MGKEDIEALAHLMRRAGFGATREELEALQANNYEATVEDLLHAERFPATQEDVFNRYLPYFRQAPNHRVSAGLWLYRMINTERPLEEKMTLFWHGLFATGGSKVIIGDVMTQQVQTFRRHALGDLRTLLVELSRNPAMVFWLDNWENHRDAPNENYGRELLELFSMGVGNYTEDDVKSSARAFTGWTFARTLPSQPYFMSRPRFQYDAQDHDYEEKEFLGEKGRFNGEDIIDIILRQPATAQFIARHMYNFFVADEVPVSAWPIEPPRDPDAVRVLSDALFESGYQIRPVLRTLFNSEFFKKAQFAKVKSPVELMVGILRLVGDYAEPDDTLRDDVVAVCEAMGQELLNPPSVEGWHTGEEWINSGALVERVNFVAGKVRDSSKPGVKSIIDRVLEGSTVSPEAIVDRCLDLLGPMEVSQSTRSTLIEDSAGNGGSGSGSPDGNGTAEDVVACALGLIVSTREYQFG